MTSRGTMRPAPLMDLAAWKALQQQARIARHGEKAKAAAKLKEGVRELLRAELKGKAA